MYEQVTGAKIIVSFHLLMMISGRLTAGWAILEETMNFKRHCASPSIQKHITTLRDLYSCLSSTHPPSAPGGEGASVEVAFHVKDMRRACRGDLKINDECHDVLVHCICVCSRARYMYQPMKKHSNLSSCLHSPKL